MEPKHVHVECDGSVAKSWLDPVCRVCSGRCGRAELRDIERLVSEHERDLHEAWNGFFTG